MGRNRVDEKLLIGIGIVIFLLNISLAWLFNIPIPYDREVIYWPAIVEYHDHFFFITLTIAILLVVYWSAGHLNRDHIWKAIATIIFSLFLVFLCLFLSMLRLLSLKNLNHIGTEKFNGSHYHLSVISQFDEEGIVLLGKCDKSKYSCRFHPILKTNIARDPKNLELDIIEDKLIISYNETILYSFDGFRENCTNANGTLCWEYFEQSE